MKRLIHTFEFAESCRSEYDLSGGLRISESSRLEVPRTDSQVGPVPVTPEYDTAQTYTARTPNFNPKAATGWELFEVRHPAPAVHPDPGISTAPYVVRFRVSNGTTDFYHDGASWVAATLDTHWNTEAEVSANLSSFDISTRTIAFVINMWTLHEDVTPRLKSLKLLYSSKLVESYDVLYESLIPELKENIRGRARVGYQMPSDANSLDLSDLEALGFESSYEITDVLEAYNYTTDSSRVTNILSSYNSGTSVVSLSETVSSGQVLWLEFEYSPAVAHQTSRDYSELSSIPSVDVTDVRFDLIQDQVNTADSVIDRDTNSGWALPGPAQKDFYFSLELTCDKQFDLQHLIPSINEWAQRKVLKMRGMDREFTLMKLSDFDISSTHSPKNLRTSKATFAVKFVSFFERPAEQANGLQSIEFSGGNLQLSL